MKFQKKKLSKKVYAKGLYLKKKLEKIKKSFPDKILSIKGKGLLLGIEIKNSPNSFCDLARKKTYF